jgi:putative hydrolase of the HAD superfamily
MGVIFAAADDVGELLIPFVATHGRNDPSLVELKYLAASRGELAAEEFWEALDVDPRLEDDYLATHRLIDTTVELIRGAREAFDAVYCLSNDVGQWSRKLRRTFALEPFVDDWFISGDIGARKPDPEIYREVLARTGREPHDFLFVDDRRKNLDAASDLGFHTLLFSSGCSKVPADRHRQSSDLTELLR